jgi:hypothetical protein
MAAETGKQKRSSMPLANSSMSKSHGFRKPNISAGQSPDINGPAPLVQFVHESRHTFDQGARTSDFETSRVKSMNASTAGLSVRFFRHTISAEIRGPGDFSGKTLKEA